MIWDGSHKTSVCVNGRHFRNHDDNIYVTLEDGSRHKVAAIGVKRQGNTPHYGTMSDGSTVDLSDFEIRYYPDYPDYEVCALKIRSVNEYGTAVISMAGNNRIYASRNSNGSIYAYASSIEPGPLLFNTDYIYHQCAIKLNNLGTFTGYVERIRNTNYYVEPDYRAFPDYDSLALYDAVAMGTTMMFPSLNSQYLAYAIKHNPFAIPDATGEKIVTPNFPFVSIHTVYKDTCLNYNYSNGRYNMSWRPTAPVVKDLYVVLYGRCEGGGYFKKELAHFSFTEILYKNFTQDLTAGPVEKKSLELNPTISFGYLGSVVKYYFPYNSIITEPDPPREKVEISYDDFTAPGQYQ